MSRGERRTTIARLRDIVRIATRHGFGYVFRRRGAKPDDPSDDRSTRAVRVREMLEELGPTFVKFGQLLSTRPDVVPQDIIVELRKLQDSARPEPFPAIRAVVEEDLGLTLEQAFEWFEEEPIGSASVGQVHVAGLPGGQEVVVKVQRPEAAATLAADIDLLYRLAALVKDRIKRLSFIDVTGIVDEFARTVRHELDYRNEARSCEAVRANFASNDHVDVPRVHWRRTAGRVLTMDRAAGKPLAHVDLSRMSDAERRTLAARIAESWMQMIFQDGLFHADPHPANIMVIGPDHIGLIDFGMMGALSRGDRESAVRLFSDILKQNSERLPRDMKALGITYPRDVEQDLTLALAEVLAQHSGASMEEIDVRGALHDMFVTIHDLQITLPSRWILLDKALVTLAGVALEISPDFSVFETARPYARQLFLERFSPERIVSRVPEAIGKYANAFLDYPLQMSELLDEFKNGEVHITINLEELRAASDKGLAAANRVAIALIAAAVILGSAVVGTLVQTGPHIFGLAWIGVPGFVAGVVLFGWIVIGMIRSGSW